MMDESKGMTPEQHAICDISERLFRHEDRLDAMDRTMKLMVRELERAAKDRG